MRERLKKPSSSLHVATMIATANTGAVVRKCGAFHPDHILWPKARGNLGPNRGLQQGFAHCASTQIFGE